MRNYCIGLLYFIHNHARKQTHTHTQTQIHNHTHTHIHTQTHTHTHKQTDAQTQTRRHNHTHTHTATQTHGHTNTQTNIHTHKHKHTLTHKYTHTHKYTQTLTHKYTHTLSHNTSTNTHTHTQANKRISTHKHTKTLQNQKSKIRVFWTWSDSSLISINWMNNLRKTENCLFISYGLAAAQRTYKPRNSREKKEEVYFPKFWSTTHSMKIDWWVAPKLENPRHNLHHEDATSVRSCVWSTTVPHLLECYETNLSNRLSNRFFQQFLWAPLGIFLAIWVRVLHRKCAHSVANTLDCKIVAVTHHLLKLF